MILLATQLSPWIRMGRPFNVFDIYTGAIEQRAESREQRAESRVQRVECPTWKYGRGIFLIQILLVWGFLTDWLAVDGGRKTPQLNALRQVKCAPLSQVPQLNKNNR